MASCVLSARRMDNDQLNIQPMILANTVVMLRFGGEYDRYFWSFAVQNLFNSNYFDYAIASLLPFVREPAQHLQCHPQPGRSFMLKAGSTGVTRRG